MAKIIDAVLRLTDQFTQPLKKASASLTQYSNQIQRCGKQVQATGKSIEKVGSSLTKSITAPLVAVGAASLNTAMNFEASMSKVQALSQASSSEMKQLSDLAKDIGATTAWSATEVADAMQYTALAGWTTKDTLAGYRHIVNLATASDMDLKTAVDQVTDALSAFGMTAGDTEHLCDMMTYTMTHTNTSSQQLAEAYAGCASTATQFGLSAEELNSWLGGMASNFVKGADAGTAMNAVLARMYGENETCEKALKSYGLSMYDANHKAKGFTQVIKEIQAAMKGMNEEQKNVFLRNVAGTNRLSDFNIILAQNVDTISEFSETLGTLDGTTAKVASDMIDNLKGKITILKSTIETASLSIGEILMPKLEKIVNVVQKAVDKFNGLSATQKEQIVKWAGIAASVGPAILIFGKVTKTVGKGILMFGKFAKFLRGITSIKALFTAILSPANLVVLGIIAIAVAAFLIIKNWDKVKAWITSFVQVVKAKMEQCGFDFSAFGKTVNKAKESVCNAVSLIKKWIKDHAEQIKAVIQVLKTTFGIIVDSIITYIASFLTQAGKILQDVIKAFTGVIDFLTGVFTGDWSKAWDGICEIAEGVFGAFVDGIMLIFKPVVDTVMNVIDKIKEALGLSSQMNSAVSGVGVVAAQNVTKTIKGHATGVKLSTGGLRRINEKGGEIVNLPNGSSVIPHDESLKKAYQSGANSVTPTVSIAKLADQIVVREESDIDKIATKLMVRLQQAAFNM